jgi:general stress protein CsbA
MAVRMAVMVMAVRVVAVAVMVVVIAVAVRVVVVAASVLKAKEEQEMTVFRLEVVRLMAGMNIRRRMNVAPRSPGMILSK